jgi:hypothetical protein
MPDLKPNEEICKGCGGYGTIELVPGKRCVCGWCAGEGKLVVCSESYTANYYRRKVANLKALLKNNSHLKSTWAELEECERFLERELNKEVKENAGTVEEAQREHHDP